MKSPIAFFYSGLIFLFLGQLLSTRSHTAAVAFNHGVASGDPLSDRVVIWTRVSNASSETPEVRWLVSQNVDMSNSFMTGAIITSAERDFTVKMDLPGLKPATTYYYQFECEGVKSVIGRTRTLPDGDVNVVQLAVVSCSNYEWGYFNALSALANRDSIDAVLHLGDYIYEYQTTGYGDTTIGRIHDPLHEIITLEDYRTRYAQYRATEEFRSVHQQHPFILIWDDHEISNNSYVDGAQNHQAEEGDYQTRKAIAKKVYYEWMPIREAEGQALYRSFHFGNLLDLIMLDERLAGRTAPSDSMTDPRFMDPKRTMLGKGQRDWLFAQLKSSEAIWKVIGNQVIFSDLHLEKVFPKRPINLDAWDGYPYEKKKIIDFLKTERVDNLIFVTGDTHCSWAFETPSSMEEYQQQGEQALVAVEFGTTSISSGNYDEYTTMDTVQVAQQAFLQSNPHLKFVNLHDHGYLLLRLTATETMAEWYYSESVRHPSDQEHLGKRISVKTGSRVLVSE